MSEKEAYGLSGSTLKYIAIITMLIDHIGAILVAPMVYVAAGARHQEILEIYRIFRRIGRIAFPIFCFFLVEGFFYTKDVRKYAFRLFLFALVSELPFDLAFWNKAFTMEGQNVFFTLLIGLGVMAALKKAEETITDRILLTGVRLGIIAAGCLTALLLNTDYHMMGILSIAVLYLYRSEENRLKQLIAGAVTFLWEPYALLAFIFLYFYNGQRGRQPKYLFYIFYPAHILVLYGLSRIL